MAPGARSDAVVHRVAAPYLGPVFDTAQAAGYAPAQLIAECGLAWVGGLEGLPESVPASDYLHLLDTGARLTGDAAFGLHVGEHVKLGSYYVYGLILLSCRNIGQALEQTMRFESLAHDLGRSELVLDGMQAEYRWHSHFPEASRHLVESVFSGIKVFGDWLTGGKLTATSICFQHEAPAELAEHQRIFGVMPAFGAPVNCARFDAALLAHAVPNADVSMFPVLQNHAEHMLKQRMQSSPGSGMVEQVKACIARNLSINRVRVAQVAEDLHMTQRTLQRKLHAAGIGFQQLLDQVRHELAIDYLARSDISIAEVAFLLGFQEQSSFHHAFKEWEGQNPGAYRQHARLDGNRTDTHRMIQ